MKDLTLEEYSKAPSVIRFMYGMAICQQPIGFGMYEKAMKDYPEYFAEELEARRKWDAVPQSVKDEYEKEREQIHRECYKDMPKSKDFHSFFMEDNLEGYAAWHEAYDKCRAVEKPLLEALHKKYYGQYGIEYKEGIHF